MIGGNRGDILTTAGRLHGATKSRSEPKAGAMRTSSALKFNQERMIAELEQLVIDYKKGDLRKYRITEIKAPVVRPKPLALRRNLKQ